MKEKQRRKNRKKKYREIRSCANNDNLNKNENHSKMKKPNRIENGRKTVKEQIERDQVKVQPKIICKNTNITKN